MKKQIKKIVAVVLMLCLFTATVTSVSAANVDDGIMPCLNNTMVVTTAMTIDTDGELTISYEYIGFSGVTTKAVVTTYIEKKVWGFFWERVDTGTTNDEYVDTFYKEEHFWNRVGTLSQSGTYRVTVQYKIYGSGGSADVIDYEGTDSF